jgi:hypothetical protein
MADEPGDPVEHPLSRIPLEWWIPTAVRWACAMRLPDEPGDVDWVEYAESNPVGRDCAAL